MNVPLTWLSEFVIIPDSVSELTDRLTMIGHMLDKTIDIDGQKVIDLELRGNRADLFGLIGIARDISAAWDVPLTLPTLAKLPSTDVKSTLITIETDTAPSLHSESLLVQRFTAMTVQVTVSKSPDWLVKKLAAYGMASINNVVDITNYVMIETGIPIHAFDKNTLKGRRLIIRRAKKNEKMTTFMGGTITLTPEDIVLADERSPQAITLVGSKDSGTTEQTKEILIEAAVYNQACVRRTSRRLGIRTEAGTRLEKHLDPNDVQFALSRALYLLQELADGNVTSALADYYPIKRKPITIDLQSTEVTRLCGITVPQKQQKVFLERLGCVVKQQKNIQTVTVPTFRTDITEQADLVEEITRIVGYETIPTHMISGELPPEQTTAKIKQENSIKKALVQLQLNEVITSTFIPNDYVTFYGTQGIFNPSVVLTNAPDPEISTLRPSLIPNLVEYTKRLLNERADRVALFELGKVYWKTTGKKETQYHEQRTLGVILSGTVDTKSYGKTPRPLTFFDIKGIIEILGELIGLPFQVNAIPSHGHPSIDPTQQVKISLRQSADKLIDVGFLGKLDSKLQQTLGVSSEILLAELSLDAFLSFPMQPTKQYQLAPQYPPIIEDVSFTVSPHVKAGEIIELIQRIDPLIARVQLLDAYQNKRTFRITYQSPKKNLSGDDVKPIRETLIQQVTTKFAVSFVE